MHEVVAVAIGHQHGMAGLAPAVLSEVLGGDCRQLGGPAAL